MADEPLRGFGAADRLFANLPEAAREQLAVELAILGREGLAMQKAATPVDSGALQAGLALQLTIERLRVRIGLLGLKRTSTSKRIYGNLYYGRIVNFGRHAQTVLRRRKKLRAASTLRNKRRPGDAVGTAKPLRVKARAATNFIDAPGREFESVAAGQLAEFWSRSFARAGGDA